MRQVVVDIGHEMGREMVSMHPGNTVVTAGG
jgi:hypothetical protein